MDPDGRVRLARGRCLARVVAEQEARDGDGRVDRRRARPVASSGELHLEPVGQRQEDRDDGLGLGAQDTPAPFGRWPKVDPAAPRRATLARMAATIRLALSLSSRRSARSVALTCFWAASTQRTLAGRPARGLTP